MTHLASTFLALQLITAVIPAEVQTLDGQKVTGVIKTSNNAGLTIVTKEETVHDFEATQLLKVQLPSKPRVSKEPPTFSILLADGSHANADQLTYQDGKVTITTRDGLNISCGSSNLRSVLLKDQSASFASQWESLHKEKILGDAIVIRKDESLSHQELIVKSITEDGVAIALEDLKTTVKLEKLEGLLFYQREDRKFPDTVCRVNTTDGSSWRVSKLNLQDDQTFSLTTASGIELEIPLESIQSFDYTDGNVFFLSDLPRDQEQWTPFVPSSISRENLSLLYAPRFDEDFRGEPLKLRVNGQLEEFSKGLALHASSELTYLLPEGVKQFKATVGLAPSVALQGDLHLKILGDRKVLSQHHITGDTGSFEIDTDISTVRRLIIIVEPGEFGDFSDQLHICQAQLLK